jgi:hypothetical protein
MLRRSPGVRVGREFDPIKLTMFVLENGKFKAVVGYG